MTSGGGGRPPETHRPRAHTFSDLSTGEIREKLRDHEERLGELESAHARHREAVRLEVDGMAHGLEAHVKSAVAPLATAVAEVNRKIDEQDRREREKERIRRELRAEQAEEERRAHERFERLTDDAGRAAEVTGRHQSLIDARINGPHKRRVAWAAVAATVLGSVVTLLIAAFASRCGH